MEPFDTKHASLTYLTNPIYQQILKQQPQATVCNNKSDIKFYRKRITALTKDMLKGEIPENSYIKTIYDTYVTGLIKYFKMVDTTDIIQQQYLKAEDIEQNVTEQIADATEQTTAFTQAYIDKINGSIDTTHLITTDITFGDNTFQDTALTTVLKNRINSNDNNRSNIR